MNKITSEEIRFIAQHSKGNLKEIQIYFDKYIYPSNDTWIKFLKIASLALGVAFLLTGIIFFFAYNWYDLDSWTKMGILQGAIIVCIAATFIPKLNQWQRQLPLISASVLVGVLMAVFGQTYQTGANTYTLFYVWSATIFLWTILSDSVPLWLLFLIILETGFDLQFSYFYNLPNILLWATVFVGTFTFLPKIRSSKYIPKWFSTIVVIMLTIHLCIWNGIYVFNNPANGLFVIPFVLFVLATFFAVYYTYKDFMIFYLIMALIVISTLLCYIFIKNNNDQAILIFPLFISIPCIIPIYRSKQK